MTDAALVWGIGTGDISLSNGDLLIDSGLQSAILLSLFCDARDDTKLFTLNNRGYWAEAENDKFGSLLWLFFREKITSQTIEKVKTFAREALAWIIEDEIASEIEVNVYRKSTYGLFMDIKVKRTKSQKYEYLWQNVRSFSTKSQELDLKVDFVSF